MKRWVLFILTLFAAIRGIPALEVDVEELEKTAGREITFINYEGPQERIEAADEIKAIGWLLAQSLKDNRAGFLLKYSVIRAVDPTVKDKLDADIFSIDREARVDHIDNIRRILAGFLEGAHAYNAEDARLLSVFITVYNAVYRGDLTYFSAAYTPLVLSHINAANAGISTLYSDWPGATRMLIPLSKKTRPGELSALSTSELTEQAVIEEMRRQPDMGLEDRKEMVELKEREVEEKQAAAETLEEEIAAERAALEDGGPSAARPEELEARKRELAEKEAESRELEAEIAAKQEEIEAEREQIVADERSQDETRAAAADRPAVYSDQLYYLRVDDRDSRGHLSGRLAVIDPEADRFAVVSPVAPVSGRSFLFFQDRILVAAHDGNGRSPARLHLLDPNTLTSDLSSEEEVYPDTLLAAASGRIYAVVEQQGACYLGAFDGGLRLAARSEEKVDPDSSLAVFGESIYVNAAGGKVLKLSVEDLSKIALLD